MNGRGYQAYAKAVKSALGPRELERMALAQTTRELMAVRDNYAPGREGYEKYADALRFNQKLWTLIQANIMENPDDGAEPLKGNLLKLSLFIDRQTLAALEDPNPDSLTPLIDINRNISGGLHGSVE